MEAKDVKNLMEAYASLYTEPEVYGNLEEAYQEPKFGKKQYIKKLSKRGGMGMGTPEDPHGYRDPKMAKVGAELSKRKTAAAKAKKTGEPDSYRAEKESQSKYQKEEFETWVNALVEEGYDLSEYTWDDMYEIYLNEAKKSDSPRQTFLPKSRERDIGRHDDWKDKPSEKWGERPEAGKKLKRRAQAVVGTQRRQDKEVGIKEGTDLFDYILEHLVAEGYADTNENALVIMANMSEEWKQSIVEADSLAAQQERRRKRLEAQRKREGRPSGGGDFGHDYSKSHEQNRAEIEQRMKNFIKKKN